MDKNILKHREFLSNTAVRLSENFIRLIITLAAGSLMLSLSFVKDVVKIESAECNGFLLWSWIAFVATLVAAGLEVFFGIKAHSCAISQMDKGHDETDREERFGGQWSCWTYFFQILAGICLILGFCLTLTYVWKNI